MQFIPEISDDPNQIIPNAAMAFRQINGLPLPYTGNKRKIIPAIHDVLMDESLEFSSVLDLFSGSSAFSYLMKWIGKRVSSNDLLTCCFLNAVTTIENPSIFLSDKEVDYLLSCGHTDRGFVSDNYMSASETNTPCRFSKFTAYECGFLDAFRRRIDDLDNFYKQAIAISSLVAVLMRLPFGGADQSIDVLNHRRKQMDHYGPNSARSDRRIGIYYDDNLNLLFDKWFRKYLTDFSDAIVSCPGNGVSEPSGGLISNLQKRREGHQEAAGYVLKSAFNSDALKLLKTNHGTPETTLGHTPECIYFDPPYGGPTSDYSNLYRFLEEYIHQRPLEEMDHIQSAGLKFVTKQEYEANFRLLLEAAMPSPLWLISYNDRSWAGIDKIQEVVRSIRPNVSIVTLSSRYGYRYSKIQGGKGSGTEYLLVARG
jgi:adenine-specific DNA methylase